MKRLFLLSTLAICSSLSSGCIRAGLATASARRIQGCRPEELAVSNTYISNPTAGPSWKATCRNATYECSGFMQLPSSVKCVRIN